MPKKLACQICTNCGRVELAHSGHPIGYVKLPVPSLAVVAFADLLVDRTAPLCQVCYLVDGWLVSKRYKSMMVGEGV